MINFIREMISLAVRSASKSREGKFWYYIGYYLTLLRLLTYTLTPPIFSIYAIRFNLNSLSFSIVC